jgi:hypothetical protein
VDNPSRRPVVSFGPSRVLARACLLGAVVAALLAGFDGDPAGRLLVGLAALALFVLGGYDSLITPRLVASATGLAVRTGLRRVQLAWTQIEDVRLDERSRLGRSSRTLEIDAGRDLLVLGRHSLGREPREVYELVSAFRP